MYLDYNYSLDFASWYAKRETEETSRCISTICLYISCI
jgi:hypothetical protein